MKPNKIPFLCVLAVAASVGAATTTNRVESANVFGLLPVTSSLSKTPIAVCFGAVAGQAVASGNATNIVAVDSQIAVSNIIKTATLSVNDELYVWDKENSRYNVYKLTSGGDGVKYWAPQTSYTIGANGETSNTAIDSAIATQKWGQAVWLYRQDTASNIYLFGQVHSSAATQTVVTAGDNLIGAPTAAAFDLNSIAWTGVNASTVSGNDISEVGDIIRVIRKDSGKTTDYYYDGTAWGYRSVTVDGNGFPAYSWTTSGCRVPAGTGFWYVRKAGSPDMAIAW